MARDAEEGCARAAELEELDVVVVFECSCRELAALEAAARGAGAPNCTPLRVLDGGSRDELVAARAECEERDGVCVLSAASRLWAVEGREALRDMSVVSVQAQVSRGFTV